MVKDQVITENYAIYNADCMEVIRSLPNESISLSVYSPPFAGLFNYSSSEKDFSNCESKEQFLEQYEFLIKEISRVTMPGRISAVHCQDINSAKNESQWDFPNEIIKLHEKHGFVRRNRITIWKEPLKVRMRTMVRSLMHKNIVEDSTECFPSMPDYVLIFKKIGENKTPVQHPNGLSEYFGDTPLLPDHYSEYGIPMEEFRFSGNPTKAIYAYIEQSFKALQKKYANWDDPQTNKLSHIIWQRYASSVWDDIRIDNVLPFKDSKEEDDEKHVHPLQLDVIDRIVELYSNPGETVLTPFMGVGSEVFSPVSLGRKAIGIELKDSYFKQAILNMKDCKGRYQTNSQLSII